MLRRVGKSLDGVFGRHKVLILGCHVFVATKTLNFSFTAVGELHWSAFSCAPNVRAKLEWFGMQRMPRSGLNWQTRRIQNLPPFPSSLLILPNHRVASFGPPKPLAGASKADCKHFLGGKIEFPAPKPCRMIACYRRCSYQTSEQPVIVSSARTWTNQYDARISMRREPLIIKEIGVMRENNSFVLPGGSEHIFVAAPEKIHFGDVSRVVAVLSQNFCDFSAHTFVHKESRLASVLQV